MENKQREQELEDVIHSLRVRIVNVATERDHFNTQLQDAKKEIQRLEELALETVDNR